VAILQGIAHLLGGVARASRKVHAEGELYADWQAHRSHMEHVCEIALERWLTDVANIYASLHSQLIRNYAQLFPNEKARPSEVYA
jgi:hypothetical protein